jgi:hypothetical protein
MPEQVKQPNPWKKMMIILQDALGQERLLTPTFNSCGVRDKAEGADSINKSADIFLKMHT